MFSHHSLISAHKQGSDIGLSSCMAHYSLGLSAEGYTRTRTHIQTHTHTNRHNAHTYKISKVSSHHPHISAHKQGSDIGLASCLACYCLGLSAEEEAGQQTGNWLGTSQQHCKEYIGVCVHFCCMWIWVCCVAECDTSLRLGTAQQHCMEYACMCVRCLLCGFVVGVHGCMAA